MPVIELSSRRSVLLALAAIPLAGAEDPPTLALLTKLAARLSDNNLPGSIDLFAKTMPGYGDLAANLGALTANYDVACTIEIREESGDATHRQAETEWFLQIKSKQQDGPTDRRNQVVKVNTALIRDKWRITSMEPMSLLTPPQVR